MEFGVPIEIPKTLVERYQKSKKDAISVLLADIEKVSSILIIAKFLK